MDFSDENGIPDRPIDKFESHSITLLDFSDMDADEYTHSELNIEYSGEFTPLQSEDKELEQVQEQLLTYFQHRHPVTKQKCLDMCKPEYPIQSILKLHIAKELEELDLIALILKDIPSNEKNGTIMWENIIYLHTKQIDISELITLFLTNNSYPIEFRYYCLRGVKDTIFSTYFKQFIQIIIDERGEFQFIIYMLECLKQINECSYEYCKLLYDTHKSVWEIPQVADFADFLLSFSDSVYTEFGTLLLKECGLTSDFYKSQQNVHMIDIKTKYIHSLLDKVVCMDNEEETIHKIEEECNTDHKKIAIKRIRYDNRLYNGKTLLYVTSRIYWYIQTFDNDKKGECMNILYEELEDMGKTCSLGHYVRLLNILGGFLPEHVITVDPKDELRASYRHKLDKAIQHSVHVDQCIDAMYTQNEMECIRYIYPLLTPITEECIQEYNGILSREEVEECIRNDMAAYMSSQ